MNLTLLGPQRRAVGARAAVAELVPAGPVAAVNAGWLEREADTRELDEVLGGRLLNLELHRRWMELRDADPVFDASQQELSERLGELRTAYQLRLQHALAAVPALHRQVRDPAVRAEAEEDGLEAVRRLDAWNLRRGQEIRDAVTARVRRAGSESLARQRAEVARMLDDSAGLVVTGGHVAILLHLLQLFGVAHRLRDPMIDIPVITWSAGAMALAERVVLFHDHPPYGQRLPEVYASGVGVYLGLVPFPHARRRLRLDDHDQVALLARRLAPLTGVLLDDGARLHLRDDSGLPGGTPRLSPTGVVLTGPVAVPGDR